ncbi:Abi family protein [Chitinophaga cymbidii]|nr:Abi family protein [Chitinophaga cymbidii]
MNMFVAPSLTISEQVQLFKDRGLIIASNDVVEHWLSHISYFRLNGYANKLRNPETGDFLPGCTFEQITRLYLFDKHLKLVLFDAIETIEVAFRTLISNQMSSVYGAHWYLNRERFLPTFRFDDFIAYLQRSMINSEDPAIKRYRKNSNDLPTLPSWIVMELLPFGSISRIFEYLSARDVKHHICSRYNLPDNILVNWLHCFSQLRNRCAHHGQIIYRSTAKTIVVPTGNRYRFLAETEGLDGSKLYSTLCCIQYLVEKIEPSSSFKRMLLQLVEDNPEIDYGYMGFPPNWRLEQIWHVLWQWLMPDETDMPEIEAGWLPLTSLFYAD